MRIVIVIVIVIILVILSRRGPFGAAADASAVGGAMGSARPGADFSPL